MRSILLGKYGEDISIKQLSDLQTIDSAKLKMFPGSKTFNKMQS